jgi:SAM-dependent methyltransferase
MRIFLSTPRIFSAFSSKRIGKLRERLSQKRYFGKDVDIHMFTWFFSRKASRRAGTTPPVQTTTRPGETPQGRRHREDVPYALPKDLEEGQRLNLQHYIFRYVLRGNYAAPLTEAVGTMLDVGSGTGIWGQEMAQLFPSARIFGLDLEPPQAISLAASAATLPENYHFVQGNLLKGLPFPDAMFDYTHQRMLVLGIPLQNWPDAIRELLRVTRPGGWVELLEMGAEILPQGPATAQFFAWSLPFLNARGIHPTEMHKLGDMLTGFGLRSVVSRPLDVPLGSWDRRLGTLMEKDILAAYRAVKPGICQSAGISAEQLEQCLQEMAQEWKRLKAVYRVYLAYGQV